MTEIAIIGMLNGLYFWKRPVYLSILAAMVDVIYGLVYAVSGSTTPVYNSTTFWVGLAITILGVCIFIYEFIWVEVFKKGRR